MLEPPQPAYFDPSQRLWILSRYVDVLAALQHPHLWPVSGGDHQIETLSRDELGRLKLRGDVLSRFSQSNLAEWRPSMESEALRILRSLPARAPVDLFREFALPWGLTVAMLATGADPADREKLAALSTCVFAATGAADNSPLRPEAASATAALERIFAHIPLGEPMFVALSQTTARMLASCWFALAGHPAGFATLRAQPGLMPAAVEEMLRFSGIVGRIYRRATGPVELGGVAIPSGDLVALMLARANHDPAQFPHPGRLDFTRPIPGHFSLGYGRNSCVGANPVRMALAVATSALVSTFREMALAGDAGWRSGSGFLFPNVVNVTLIA
ncbi:MAG TPA: cytochrome P450 [Bryobacteraceae bacterium]|nr:cytochrome P450 [Bryobacteraceae bacterium]